LLPAVPQDAADLDTAELQAGQVRWATIDSPWVHRVDRGEFGHALDGLRAIEPAMVWSSHLPPAPGAMLDLFIQSLALTPAADPFVGPDHAALEAMLAGMVDLPAYVGIGVAYGSDGNVYVAEVFGAW
jgi:hypothetical protein